MRTDFPWVKLALLPSPSLPSTAGTTECCQKKDMSLLCHTSFLSHCHFFHLKEKPQSQLKRVVTLCAWVWVLAYTLSAHIFDNSKSTCCCNAAYLAITAKPQKKGHPHKRLHTPLWGPVFFINLPLHTSLYQTCPQRLSLYTILVSISAI